MYNAVMEEASAERAQKGRLQYVVRFSVLFARFLFDKLIERVHIMLREFDLFSGVGLFLLGLLNFNTGRYCDGNTGDYLSCTRPAVYYYFDAFDIVLIVLGIFLFLFWYVKRNVR